MGMNMIRNGGFERGTTDFWKAFDHSSFAASTIQKYKGSYAGKINAGAATEPYIMNNDFIKIVPGEAFILKGYGYPSTYYSLTPQVLYYDEGLSLKATRNLITKTLGTTQWTEFTDVVSYEQGAEYFKIKLKQGHSGVDEYTYWDSLSLYKIDVQELIGEIQQIFTSQYMEGGGTWTGDIEPVFGYKEAVFILDVTAKDNDTGTLDVKVQTYDRYNVVWHDIASFSQVTTTLGEQVLVVTAGIGEIIRCQMTQAGTNPGFTARTSAILKR